ncbi:hypothetical protein T492DRAFT_832259 [Pavlovales sp. CCMP2436]|nr:hypothetical protein T492DRAFT_832259 [Pavlovales sp. CCMP2436]
MARGPMGEQEDEFEDFLAKIENVSKTISGLKDGSIAPSNADEVSDKIDADEVREREKREARRRLKIEERLVAEAGREDHEILKVVHKDKVQELKLDYYHRKNRRERWEEYRRTHPSRTMDYRGWELFEDDPDEDLWAHESGDKPQVQDQGAFDAMAKDCEERAAKRAGQRQAADAERERGNAALRAGQFSESLSRYDAAIGHDKGDKGLFTNRALAHLKVPCCLAAKPVPAV